MKFLCSAAALAVFCITNASAATIVNGSFELPLTSSYLYNPTDPTGGWTFLQRTGVAINTFFAGAPPDGNQAAFVQQYVDEGASLSTISQSLSGVLLSSATLTFYLAQRPGTGYGVNPIVVTYGSQTLGTFTPGSTTFTLFSVTFTPTATSGLLSFRSAASTTGDLDTALDNVVFTQPTGVPEPASLALILPGLAALMLRRRYKRS